MKSVLAFDIGIKNMSMCGMQFNHENKEIKAVNKWDTFDISITSDGYKINNNDFLMLSENLIAILSQLFKDQDDFEYDYIVIENQPVLKNPIMKSLQITLYTFFLMLKHNKQSKENDKRMSISFLNASNKLKPTRWVTKGDIDVINKEITGTDYIKRKKQSVAMCNFYLEQHYNPNANESTSRDFREYFNKLRKKDDYADTFNMCLYFINAL